MKNKTLLFLFIGLAIAVIILFVMKVKAAKKAEVSAFPLVPGITGKAVAMLQAANGVAITGTYDGATDAALALNGNGHSISLQQWLDSVALAEDITVKTPITTGSNNVYVQLVQIMLGLTPDGNFDSRTAQALQLATGQTEIASYNDYRNLITKTIGI